MKTLMMIAVLSCSLANAQTAKVVELPKHEAEQAKQLYKAKVAADKAWDDFNVKLKTAHKSFWDIEFSDDFRFIVPKPSTLPNWSTGGVTTMCPSVSNSAQFLMNPMSSESILH